MKNSESNLPWRELAADHVSGASEIYARALQAVEQFLSGLDQTQISLPHRPEWLRALTQAQPAMAPMYNLANALALILEQEHLEKDERIAQARAFLQKEALQSRWSNAAIAEHALTLIATKSRVLTHSYSGTVAAALEYARENAVHLEVYLSEGRPANEGRRMAERLARAGMSVHFFVDDARAHFMRMSDIVLLGADRISEKGFVNKIGSRSLTQLASLHQIPVAVLAARNKLWPAHLPFGKQPAHARAEVWAEAPPGIVIHNFYFEEIELSGAHRIITENGIFKPARIHTEMQNFPAAEFWKET